MLTFALIKTNIMSGTEQQQEFLTMQVEALRNENTRLNNELRKFKELAFKVRLSDPNFDKPLSQIETNFEIIKPNE